MSIEQRLDIFAPPTSSSKRREIAVHLRDNPRQVFDMDRLMEAVPGLKKGYAAATLQLMSDAGLIKQVEAGVRSRVQAKYRLSS
jgi:hypothetical protein